jgi:hypothetical protein
MAQRDKPRRPRATKPWTSARRPASLEKSRQELLQRLNHLGPEAKSTPGYKSAMTLLNRTFRASSLSARIGVLQAAGFMIEVLERTAPLA